MLLITAQFADLIVISALAEQERTDESEYEVIFSINDSINGCRDL